jgi:hypothetical protein
VKVEMEKARIMWTMIIINTIAAYATKIISMGEVYGILTFLFLNAMLFELLMYRLERKRKIHFERMNKK